MRRDEAIAIAKKLSNDEKYLAVVFDRRLNDFFISESEYFRTDNLLFEQNEYEIVKVFNMDPAQHSFAG